MNRNRWIVLGGMLAALMVSAAIGTSAVYADTSTPPAPPDERAAPPDGLPGMRRLDPVGLQAAAGVLGMTTDELSAALDEGTTLQQLATDKGIAIEDVHAAIQTAHKQEMLERIKEAVSNGTMSQDKADWLIVGLEKGYLDGPGLRLGPGLGFGGPRGGPGPVPQATQQP